MKTAYIDTNVIISKIKPHDPFHSETQRLFTQPYVRNISSSLFLVELKSVLSKQAPILEENLPLKAKELSVGLTHSEKVELFFNFILETSIIEVIENPITEQVTIGSSLVKLPTSYSIALRMAGKTQLRTLDNLHFAHLLLLERDTTIHFDYLVTGDKMILNQRKKLNKLLEITVVTPKELESLEG